MNRRILIFFSVIALLIGLCGITYAQDEEGSGIVPVPLELEDDDLFDDVDSDDADSDGSVFDTEEEVEPIKEKSWTVAEENLFKVSNVETMTDEDGNLVIYKYNDEDEILEKIIVLCPPKEILDEIMRDKLLRYREAYPHGYYGWAVPGSDLPLYEDIEGVEVEIEGLEEFYFEEQDFYSSDDDFENMNEGIEEESDINITETEEGFSEEISVSIFDDEETEEIPVEFDLEEGEEGENGEGTEMIEDEIGEEVTIEDFTEEDRYMIDDVYKSPLEKGLDGEEDGKEFPYPEKYINTLNEKYTIYTPEQSYIESILVREAYETGRITILVPQDIIIDWEDESYSCDLQGSFDSYHYLDGLLVSKFEVRKGLYKVLKYDQETGNIVSERIHQSRAGNTYDLYIFNSNGEVLRQEIYYNGELAYSKIPGEDREWFENVKLKFDMYGNLIEMNEVILNDMEETINSNIVEVDFSIYDIPVSDRAEYAEIGFRKTYFDNWEMVSKVEIYQFDGNKIGEFGPKMKIDGGLAVVRYYDLNGMIIREERYAQDKLYSTILFTFDEMGFISRISYVDVFSNVYKYKEGGSFYDGTGKELSEEEFIKVTPDYDFGYLTDEYITEDGRELLVGDDFYSNLQKFVLGYSDSEESDDYGVFDDDDDDVSDDDELEEGFMEETDDDDDF